MSFNVGLIGCGKWSTVIIKEINNHKFFNLEAIVCRNKSKKFNKSIKVFSNTQEMIDKSKINCVYIATTPEVNLDIIKIILKKNLPIILEKPIANNSKSSLKLKKILQSDEIIIMPNLSNIFSECFIEIENFVKKNKFEIKRIIICEGGMGPFRDRINPIWDWGFHSISLIFKLFKNDNISELKKKIIKENNLFGYGLVTRFDLTLNKSINVKILTGNLFKKKNRYIKVMLKNNDFLMCDFINHKVYINNNLIFRSETTPLNSLFNIFYSSIRNNDFLFSEDLINTSCKTIRFLEKFYKCSN